MLLIITTNIYFISDIEWPEKAKLGIQPKVPQYPVSMRPFKMQKKLRLMRGPERVHTEFIHKQFGIIVSKNIIQS